MNAVNVNMECAVKTHFARVAEKDCLSKADLEPQMIGWLDKKQQACVQMRNSM